MKTPRIKSLCLSVMFLWLLPEASAQNVLDGVYVKEHTISRKPIPYAYLREADVMWHKRIWRNIDLREKMNHPLYYPDVPTNGRMALFDVIKKGIQEGELFAYEPLFDDFRVQLTLAEVMGILEEIKTRTAEDIDNPGMYYEVTDTVRQEARNIREYLVKEDWFIDRERSVLDVRIVGIAPVVVTVDEESGAERGKKILFWLYYPNCRNLFANYEVFNRFNDAERRTYEDIFWKRFFSSYITKESNVYDRRISDYYQGLDALIEANRIKNDIFTLEMDLWHY